MNLLPIQQKERIKFQILYQNIVFSGLILIFLILVLIIFLGVFLVFLNFKYQTIEQDIIFEQSRVIKTETVKSMEKKIKDLNKELISLKKIQNSKNDFYQTLNHISQDLLVNVDVYSVEIDSNLDKITISGFSPTRDRLLAIKQKLESLPEYKNVDFPISNLTNSSNIDFYFSFSY